MDNKQPVAYLYEAEGFKDAFSKLRLPMDVMANTCKETALYEYPIEYITGLEKQLSEALAALKEIGNYAHDRSTGPTVPDLLWDIRSMAYDGLEGLK